MRGECAGKNFWTVFPRVLLKYLVPIASQSSVNKTFETYSVYISTGSISELVLFYL